MPNLTGPAGTDRREIVVLLIDDQTFVGAAVGRLLATEDDIRLHCCTDGLAAIDTANRLNPRIILQDLVMPGIDGLTLVRLLRTNALTMRTPVIVLSGNDDPETRVRALALGADDFLVKLPAKDDLIACIRRHAAADVTSEAELEAVSADRPAATPRQETAQTLDPSVLAAFREADTGASSSFMLKFIDQFIREAASQVELLKDAARRADAPALEATAHRLKGSSMTIGAQRLAALCARVEDCPGGTPAAPASGVLAEIDREFLRLRDALAEERHMSERL